MLGFKKIYLWKEKCIYFIINLIFSSIKFSFFCYIFLFYRIPKRIADAPTANPKLEMEVVPGSVNHGYNMYSDQPK